MVSGLEFRVQGLRFEGSGFGDLGFTSNVVSGFASVEVVGTEIEVPGCSAAEVVCGCSVDLGDVCRSGIQVQGWGSGLGVWGLGLGVQGLRLTFEGYGCRV